MENIGILDPLGKNPNPLTGQPYSEIYKELAKKWSKFPAYKNAKNILKTLEASQVTLVISQTGSGKTVLLPKFLLHTMEYKKHIAIILPKQIITKGAAEFAAATLDVPLGNHVNYQYKGSETNTRGKQISLLYATDGTLVNKLLTDPSLSDLDGVIIDEAHERKVQTDLLLYLLRNTLKLRPEFKLVIMSATIDEQLFRSYFVGYRYANLELSGDTHYPIEQIFIDNELTSTEFIKKGFETIKKILENINTDPKLKGDILFFVTSVSETEQVCRLLSTVRDSNKYCIEVFANMDENRLNKKPEDIDKVRVIVATNVAESSLTIEGIKYVIDSGFELISYYDPEQRAKVLEKKLITQAQAIQRKGRAGRMSSGTCYHLYTKDAFENKMRKFPEPAIRTSNIYQECLRFMNLPNVQTTDKLIDILSNFIEPPREKYMSNAIRDLVKLGLVDGGSITKIGKQVADMQLDPMAGLTLLYGYQMMCAKELSAIFAVIDSCRGSLSELFMLPASIGVVADSGGYQKLTEKYNKARNKLSNRYGDHLTILNIFGKYKSLMGKGNKEKGGDNKEKASQWCYENFIKRKNMEKARKQYEKIKGNLHKVIGSHGIPENALNSKKAEIDQMKLEHKILTCLYFGFGINVVDKKNMSANVGINRDSFVNVGGGGNVELVYNELVSNSGKLEINIVSRLPTNMDIYKKLKK